MDQTQADAQSRIKHTLSPSTMTSHDIDQTTELNINTTDTSNTPVYDNPTQTVKVDRRKRESYSAEEWTKVQAKRLEAFRSKQAAKKQKITEFDNMLQKFIVANKQNELLWNFLKEKGFTEEDVNLKIDEE